MASLSSSSHLHSPFLNRPNNYAGVGNHQHNSVVTPISLELGSNMGEIMDKMFQPRSPYSYQTYGSQPITGQNGGIPICIQVCFLQVSLKSLSYCHVCRKLKLCNLSADFSYPKLWFILYSAVRGTAQWLASDWHPHSCAFAVHQDDEIQV